MLEWPPFLQPVDKVVWNFVSCACRLVEDEEEIGTACATGNEHQNRQQSHQPLLTPSLQVSYTADLQTIKLATSPLTILSCNHIYNAGHLMSHFILNTLDTAHSLNTTWVWRALLVESKVQENHDYGRQILWRPIYRK